MACYIKCTYNYGFESISYQILWNSIDLYRHVSSCNNLHQHDVEMILKHVLILQERSSRFPLIQWDAEYSYRCVMRFLASRVERLLILHVQVTICIWIYKTISDLCYNTSPGIIHLHLAIYFESIWACIWLFAFGLARQSNVHPAAARSNAQRG